MAWNFGESFDLYAATADAANGYWDSAVGGSVGNAGRFANSRALSVGFNVAWTKTSGVNDPVHHLVFSVMQSSALSGASLGFFCTLYDGTTAQCTVVLRSDGAILLLAGGTGGATLATFVGAITGINAWFAIEVEIVVNSTTGSFAVRVNGASTNSFSATGLNTRASANNYANKLIIGGVSNGVTHFADDLYWRSGAAVGSWLGDLRCYARMPITDASVHFAQSGARNLAFSGGSGNVLAVNRAFYWAFVMPADGQISSMTITLITAYTGGNLKCALFADNAGSPGAVLASATSPLAAPAAGVQTFSFSPAVALTNGQKVWLAVCGDIASSGSIFTGGGTAGWFGTTTYASFPVANPASLNANQQLTSSINISGNAVLVNEAQQDGGATYVYDSTAGDADFYGIGNPLAATPFNTVAVITRAYMAKTDAGTRTGAVQLKSGATTVASPTLSPPGGGGFQWASRLDLVDPNTGAAWTAAAVTAAQIGPVVVT